jgi:hypothetical protein
MLRDVLAAAPVAIRVIAGCGKMRFTDFARELDRADWRTCRGTACAGQQIFG